MCPWLWSGYRKKGCKPCHTVQMQCFLCQKPNTGDVCQQLISQPFLNKLLLSGSSNQATKDIGLLIQHYNSLLLKQLCTKGSRQCRPIKVVISFIRGWQPLVSLPASPQSLSSPYLDSATHCTISTVKGMRLNLWNPQPSSLCSNPLALHRAP